jgi:hypothetical protein
MLAINSCWLTNSYSYGISYTRAIQKVRNVLECKKTKYKKNIVLHTCKRETNILLFYGHHTNSDTYHSGIQALKFLCHRILSPVLSSLATIMAIVFWDRQSVLFIDFLERGGTISSERYCQTLQNLWRAIQNKRRGKLSSKILFLHDNARPYTANLTQKLLNSFNWKIFPHPHYSSDLAFNFKDFAFI